MTKKLPPEEIPTLQDIRTAINTLFPEAPQHINQPGWRPLTIEEHEQIKKLAYQIMIRRKTLH